MYSTFDDVIKNEKNIVLDDVLPIINYAMENNKLDKVYEWSKI
jgi:hypothetical protein